jgi:hypothetical protein
MGTTLPPDEMELYRRVDEVLHYLWDPCGVSGAPQARDEYYGYLPEVFRLVKDGATAQEIAHHLAEIERTGMELDEDIARLEAIGETLVRWRVSLFGPHA